MIYRTAICLLSLTACISLSAAQETPQTPAQAVHVSAEVAADLLVSKVDPLYPPLARQARIQGVVRLKVIVGNTGDIEDVQLVSGHPMLAPAAIAAVKQWKYRPYLLNGEPIRADIQVQINFTLSNNPPAADVAGDQPAGETADQASDHLGAIVSAVACDDATYRGAARRSHFLRCGPKINRSQSQPDLSARSPQTGHPRRSLAPRQNRQRRQRCPYRTYPRRPHARVRGVESCSTLEVQTLSAQRHAS